MSRISWLVTLSFVVIAGAWWLAVYEPAATTERAIAPNGEPQEFASGPLNKGDLSLPKLPSFKEHDGISLSKKSSQSQAPAKQSSPHAGAKASNHQTQTGTAPDDSTTPIQVAAGAREREISEESIEEAQAQAQERREAAERQAIMKVYENTLGILREGDDGNQ